MGITLICDTGTFSISETVSLTTKVPWVLHQILSLPS